MANEIKIKRYESLILETINKTIVFEVKNKIARQGRITYVQLSKDLSRCKAYVECQDRSKVAEVVNELNSISGLFRSKVCEVLDIFKTPKIIFELDKTIDYAENIENIIKQINSKE